MSEGTDLPAGFGVVLDAGTRRPDQRLLTGGSPWRLVRLSTAGARQLDRWAAGVPVGSGAGAVSLARRLIDAGLAHPFPPPGIPADLALSVVIPVRDRPAGLAATLTALGRPPAVREIVVVDDASRDPAATDAVAAAAGPPVRVVHRTGQGGPAGARNTGWRAATGDVVAFLDADCLPAASWLEPLLAHLGDPTVGAVAPRVVAAATPGAPGWLARYEQLRSPLDLGRRPATVRPRSPVPYVPTAALVVRRSALVDLDGFDESMTVGEDVDLIWRLVTSGWRVRYEPGAEVSHPVRATGRRWLAQRYAYGTSAAPLAERHGAAVSPLEISPWSAAGWLLVVTVSPAAGSAVLFGSVAAVVLGRRTKIPAAVLAPRLVSSQLRAGQAGAEAARRVWWPLLALAALRSTRARRVALATLVPLVGGWLFERPRPRMGMLAWVGIRLLDDAAYGVGVWSGVVRSGRMAALLPRRPVRG